MAATAVAKLLCMCWELLAPGAVPAAGFKVAGPQQPQAFLASVRQQTVSLCVLCTVLYRAAAGRRFGGLGMPSDGDSEGWVKQCLIHLDTHSVRRTQ